MEPLPLISESDVKRTTYPDGVVLTKHVFVNCDCGTLDHAARVTLHKEYRKNPNKPQKDAYLMCEDVSFDFNMTERVNVAEHGQIIHHTDTPLKKLLRPVDRFFRRLDAAIDLVLDKPVYISADMLLTFENARELASKIKTSIEEVRRAK